jgi:hypothetical protein
LVNASRVVKKLPALLCDGDTSVRLNHNAFMRSRYKLQLFKRKRPDRCSMLVNELVSVLEKIEREMQTK